MKNHISPYVLFLDDTYVLTIQVKEAKESSIMPPEQKLLPKNIENFYLDSICLLQETGKSIIQNRKSNN